LSDDETDETDDADDSSETVEADDGSLPARTLLTRCRKRWCAFGAAVGLTVVGLTVGLN